MTWLALGRSGGAKPRPDWPLLLACAAFALFLVSLALPAVSLHVLGKPSPFEGWRALACGVAFGASALAEFIMDRSRGLPVGLLLLACSALLNLVFLTPALWLRAARGRRPSRAAIAAWALGLALAAVAPEASGFEDMTRLSGYFVWILAWSTLGVAMLSAHREAPTFSA